MTTETVEITKRKKKEAPVQTDILGTELKIGDIIAVARGNSLYVYRVCKITAKMIRAKALNSKYAGDDGDLVYSSNAIKLDGPDAMAYVLRNS